jgi:hypothetical protein
MTRISSVLAALTLVLFGGAGHARAGLIAYTESVIGSGSLDGQGFTDSQVTLTFVADPNTVYEPIYRIFVVNAISATVQVGAVTDTLAGSYHLFDYQPGPSVGLASGTAASPGPDILDTDDPAFASYNLATFIGPITDSGSITGNTYATDSGSFQLTSISGDVTFTAASAAPEPAAFLLMGFGLFGVSAIKFARRS